MRSEDRQDKSVAARAGRRGCRHLYDGLEQRRVQLEQQLVLPEHVREVLQAEDLAVDETVILLTLSLNHC